MLPRRFSTNLLRLARLRSRSLKPVCGRERCYSRKTEDEEKDEPVRYSQSKAAAWTAQQSLGQPLPVDESKEPPRFQGQIVNLSVVIFMIYFCILREENDLDDMLKTDLYKPLPWFTKP